ncbi:hypothetical protein PROFUN_11866 [Planoprotostelium fungivorum]|uniref:Uncharacterized protein n=1 Tax=Planoprotostelium fungivorum TaxID=1890364 RepID=A0A2P6N9C6_9EUKA|nr:hypothetical protein PROFUN_11866 [Planoprotostelium fungivorum]
MQTSRKPSRPSSAQTSSPKRDRPASASTIKTKVVPVRSYNRYFSETASKKGNATKCRYTLTGKDVLKATSQSSLLDKIFEEDNDPLGAQGSEPPQEEVLTQSTIPKQRMKIDIAGKTIKEIRLANAFMSEPVDEDMYPIMPLTLSKSIKEKHTTDEKRDRTPMSPTNRTGFNKSAIMNYTNREQDRIATLLSKTTKMTEKEKTNTETQPIKPKKLDTPRSLGELKVMQTSGPPPQTMDRSQRLSLAKLVKEDELLAISARRAVDYERECQLWLTLGMTSYNHGRYKKAVRYLQSGIEAASHGTFLPECMIPQKWILSCWNHMGISYFYIAKSISDPKGEFSTPSCLTIDPGLPQENADMFHHLIQQSMACHQNQISLSPDSGGDIILIIVTDRISESCFIANCNAGICQETLGQDTEAFKYFRQALACAIHVGNLSGQNLACEHIVVANLNQKDYKVARMYLLKRLKILQEMKDAVGAAVVHQQLGEMIRVWRGAGDVESKDHFAAAVQVLNAEGPHSKAERPTVLNEYSAANAYLQLGEIANMEKDYRLAVEYYHRALDASQHLNLDSELMSDIKTGLGVAQGNLRIEQAFIANIGKMRLQ